MELWTQCLFQKIFYSLFITVSVPAVAIYVVVCSRYPFYASQVVGFRIEPLIWLRYTLWIPLYPLGILFEGIIVMIVMWGVMDNQCFSKKMPGQENETLLFVVDQEMLYLVQYSNLFGVSSSALVVYYYNDCYVITGYSRTFFNTYVVGKEDLLWFIFHISLRIKMICIQLYAVINGRTDKISVRSLHNTDQKRSEVRSMNRHSSNAVPSKLG